MIQVIYYRDKCIGCGSCADIAPDWWVMDEQDGKSTLLKSVHKRNNIFITKVEADEVDYFVNSSDSCPIGIIEVRTC